jgi:murein DD-endopeptidase MepM/ murein hydrolase activator NlpD
MTDEDALLAVTAPRRRSRLRRAFVIVATVIAAILVCLMGTAFALLDGLFGDDGSTYNAVGCGNGQPVDPKGPMPQIAELVEDQVRIAAIVVKTGQDMNVPPRGWVIAVATALQESRLQNLPDLGPSNDHDSIGVFQQRPSQGWGTVQQLADPAYQARKFYEKLLTVTGWETMPLTQAAQVVQVSAFPDAYAKQEPLATKVVDALTGGAGRAAGYDAALQCAAGYDIAASGWTVPVIGPIVSGFRTPDRPAHDGVDIGAPKGTPIHAAAAGVVLTVLCNATLNGQPYSCDQDGSEAVLGCGWYVDILHAGRVITRYCHQMQRPFVNVGDYVGAGTVIGVSGSSGNSSGPHVHFEVHLNGDPSSAGAVDPVAFMNQVGAPLGVGSSA